MNWLYIVGDSFFTHYSLTIPIKTMSRKMTEKETYGMCLIKPKLRDQVMIKEDDKGNVKENSSISTLTGIIYMGMGNYDDSNS